MLFKSNNMLCEQGKWKQLVFILCWSVLLTNQKSVSFKDNSPETPMKPLSVQMILPGKELLKSTSEIQAMGELVVV